MGSQLGRDAPRDLAYRCMSEMGISFSEEEVFTFFRLGLATGIVEPKTLVAWADKEIENNPNFSPEVIELSLSGSLPISEVLWLLNSFIVFTKYERPMQLLFAAAGVFLEREEKTDVEIISSLLLVNAEGYLPENVKEEMATLGNILENYRREQLSPSDLRIRLAEFLNPYSRFRPQLFTYIGTPDGS